MSVYESISAVMADLSKDGIAKTKRNSQQGYNFRGIDDVYNALSSVMAAHNLVMLPRVLSRFESERETKNGGALKYVVVDVEFDLVCATDGSTHTIRVCGEAMDSADKATNKAMSAAFKYAAMQAFCIPTEGDNDADATTHEVKPLAKPEAPKGKPAPEAPTATPEQKADKWLSGRMDESQVRDFKTLCQSRDIIWVDAAREAIKAKCETSEQVFAYMEGNVPA